MICITVGFILPYTVRGILSLPEPFQDGICRIAFFGPDKTPQINTYQGYHGRWAAELQFRHDTNAYGFGKFVGCVLVIVASATLIFTTRMVVKANKAKQNERWR